jgi:hypothetical protein
LGSKIDIKKLYYQKDLFLTFRGTSSQEEHNFELPVAYRADLLGKIIAYISAVGYIGE